MILISTTPQINKSINQQINKLVALPQENLTGWPSAWIDKELTKHRSGTRRKTC